MTDNNFPRNYDNSDDKTVGVNRENHTPFAQQYPQQPQNVPQTPYTRPYQPTQSAPVQKPVVNQNTNIPVQNTPVQNTQVHNPYASKYSSVDEILAPNKVSPQQSYKQPDDGFTVNSYDADKKPEQEVKVENPYTNMEPKRSRKKKKGVSKAFVAFMLVICIIISSAIGFGGAVLYMESKTPKTPADGNSSLVLNTVNIDEQTAQKLADKPTSQITDEVADTVVEITTEVMSTSLFYGQYISQGAGSGVIISSDGYIVTNNHVIEGASKINVTLRNQTTYEAELIGTDSVIDIALLKIDAKDLKAAKIGDSDKLKVGDKAVAIGNPLGQLGGTVTDGIISALDRDVVVGDETMRLLQTDTAINPGNSGGGLFDGQGVLIGVVVAKSSGAEIEGLGFAVPINDAVEVIDDLKQYGYVRGRVALGVELMDISNSLFSMYYYGTSESGCYINGVVEGSAAEKAGLQQGDRIISVDGTEVSTAAEVENAIDGKKVNDKVVIEIDRKGKVDKVTVKLEEYVPEEYR